jgi:hypothetical protein
LQVLPQLPATHVAIPLAGASHTWPHAPQFSGSELVSMQFAPQGLYPLSQAMLQVDAAHTAEPCCGVGHALSQLPQWLADVAVSTQAPPQLTAPL